MFGESNADEDVSPDTADPEAAASAGKEALATESNKEVSFPSITVRAQSKNQSINTDIADNYSDNLMFFLGKCRTYQHPNMGPGH